MLLLLLTDATGYSPASPLYENDDDYSYEAVVIPWSPSASEPVPRSSTPILLSSAPPSPPSTLSDVDVDDHHYNYVDDQHHSAHHDRCGMELFDRRCAQVAIGLAIVRTASCVPDITISRYIIQ